MRLTSLSPNEIMKKKPEQLASIVLAVLSLALSAHSPAADTPVASDPIFTALKTDGSTVVGRIRQFGQDGEITLVLNDGEEKAIPATTLVKLTREGFAQSAKAEVSGDPFSGWRPSSGGPQRFDRDCH